MMMDAYYSFLALSGLDENCAQYIENVEKSVKEVKTESVDTLESTIIKGLKDVAYESCKIELEAKAPMDVINTVIIPSLNKIGNDFEIGKAYLPQLLMSADAAAAAFEVVKTKIDRKTASVGEPVVLATVKGDIHDIGKNIVKVVLESYGFDVVDLGKDVAPDVVCDSVASTGAKLVGLSALMTTTVPAMEETIKLVRERYPDVKIIVGGAVLTEEYASVIGADYYAADAMDAAKVARAVYSN